MLKKHDAGIPDVLHDMFACLITLKCLLNGASPMELTAALA